MKYGYYSVFTNPFVRINWIFKLLLNNFVLITKKQTKKRLFKWRLPIPQLMGLTLTFKDMISYHIITGPNINIFACVPASQVNIVRSDRQAGYCVTVTLRLILFSFLPARDLKLLPTRGEGPLDQTLVLRGRVEVVSRLGEDKRGYG